MCINHGLKIRQIRKLSHAQVKGSCFFMIVFAFYFRVVQVRNSGRKRGHGEDGNREVRL